MSMNPAAAATPESAARPAPYKPPRETIYRHTALVRLTHWINALAVFVMIGSGLNIFNAHPQLYWGLKGANFDKPWLAIHAVDTPHGPRGQTLVGALHVDTTGFLGWSQFHGHAMNRAWPGWLTIPSFQDLADSRHWHFLFAWVLAINALIYLIWSLSSRHLQRDLAPTLADLKAIPSSIVDHVRLKHPTGEAAKRYNVLQRLAYLGVTLLVTGMMLTGLSLSPGFNAFAPWLLDLFGGRQSARSLHFLFMLALVAFIAVHLTEVVLAGPYNNIRSMVTGRYAVPPDQHEPMERR